MIEWDDDGNFLSVEPYFEGQIHGRAKLPTDLSMEPVMTSGAGEWWEGLRAGVRSPQHAGRCSSGYEWWMDADQRSTDHERHWSEGNCGDIRAGGGTIRGNCIGDTRSIGSVVKRLPNVSTSKQPRSRQNSPRFRAKDNSPRRQFPTVVQNMLLQPTAAQLKRLNHSDCKN